MENVILPKNIEKIFDLKNAESILSALMIEIVKSLNCDRCFIYLRDPDTRLGKAVFCYCRQDNIPDVTGNEWKLESSRLKTEDPMFAAALQCQPTIFIEDVETASPKIVNRQFEREHFGHRALIHAHLCREWKLWGVLQPCVFSQPRIWTESNRQLINTISEKITPLVIEYVEKNLNFNN